MQARKTQQEELPASPAYFQGHREISVDYARSRSGVRGPSRAIAARARVARAYASLQARGIAARKACPGHVPGQQALGAGVV